MLRMTRKFTIFYRNSTHALNRVRPNTMKETWSIMQFQLRHSIECDLLEIGTRLDTKNFNSSTHKECDVPSSSLDLPLEDFNSCTLHKCDSNIPYPCLKRLQNKAICISYVTRNVDRATYGGGPFPDT